MAIVEPWIAGLTATLLVGWLLIFGGVVHFMALFSGGVGRFFWQLLLGILYVLAGLYFLTHPELALATLTLFLAGILFAEAFLEAFAYFRLRGQGASGWLLVNAFVTLLLGGLIWFHWPSSSVWAIGTIVGVKLLFTGFSRLMLGTTLRAIGRHVAA